jgi:hypothetical protein
MRITIILLGKRTNRLESRVFADLFVDSLEAAAFGVGHCSLPELELWEVDFGGFGGVASLKFFGLPLERVDEGPG